MEKKFSINIDELVKLTKGYTYKENGNYYERKYGEKVLESFPNSEEFWRKFITPMTNRIDSSFKNRPEEIHSRNGIDPRLENLSALHYSIYINLVYAADCFKQKQLAFFENFYTHLSAACDIAEEFLIQLYLIILECEESVSKWCNKLYHSICEDYLRKGIFVSWKKSMGDPILDEYCGNLSEWKDYKTFAKDIRTYRHVIVHNSHIESREHEGKDYVPIIKKISKYKKWHQIHRASESEIKSDFVERGQAMKESFCLTKEHLNLIWKKPLEDFSMLLYTDKNPKLLDKYNLVLTC